MIYMIEPNIDKKSFKKDVEAGVSALDLKEKYVLTSRQYRKLIKDIERKKPAKRKRSKMKRTVRTYFNEPYISIDANTEKYGIRRSNIYYGLYDDLETAKEVKEKLIEKNWDKSELNNIRYELGLEPINFRK